MTHRDADDTAPTSLGPAELPTTDVPAVGESGESILESATVEDSDALMAPTLALGSLGAVPSAQLPSHESATEIDPRMLEDATSAQILDAFAPPAGDGPITTPTGRTPQDSTPPDPTPSGYPTPTPDPHGRFERLRVPSREEIQDAIQGTPTLAMDADPVKRGPPDPETLVDETAPVKMPKKPELRRIVERARAPDPASTSPRARSVRPADPALQALPPSDSAREPSLDLAKEAPHVVPAALPVDLHVSAELYPPTPRRDRPPVLAWVAGGLALVALGLALMLLVR